MEARVTLRVDGERRSLMVDTRVTLLDALRERLGVISPKKGCDHGQCGACTVLVDSRRMLACLALAVALDGAEVTTAAGLSGGDELRPLQRLFIEHDAFQCGYCAPGHICSAAGMLAEAARGWPSYVTADLAAPAKLDDAEIRERMNGLATACGVDPVELRCRGRHTHPRSSHHPRQAPPVRAGHRRLCGR